MKHSPLRNAAILAVLIVVIFFSFWEYHLRSQGLGISYDDGKEFWTNKRATIYEPANKATVFIGSSRHKYDLDIATWQSLTGERAIQLAFEGTSPIPALDDLANDTLFKGKLVIDVTEGLTFSPLPFNLKRINDALAYRKKITPAQRFGFQVNHVLESQFVFLDRDFFSLNALLNKSGIPPRAGVYGDLDFPVEFGRVNFERQDKMTEKFTRDTSLQNKVKDIWASIGKMNAMGPPPTQAHFDSIFSVIKTDVEKIRSRGGQILFVRSPSTGPFREGEKKAFPREKFWDRILTSTGSQGIHFEDYPSLAHFQCPEFSHLTPADAIVYTTNLIEIIEREKGWSFPNKPAIHSKPLTIQN